jgi:hypothetical protein
MFFSLIISRMVFASDMDALSVFLRTVIDVAGGALRSAAVFRGMAGA